ncbi:hypothetical protein AAFF_G00423150 [Aldrovandia affinis]|uniref:Uncharacterized protein n=1 Tax=Aldrovandia affinis TaxID=143900 RepID=A0AAD7X022_9TELE|nr:hypothetical protein AAFF_G00423150 [Aldrovandia affinis]
MQSSEGRAQNTEKKVHAPPRRRHGRTAGPPDEAGVARILRFSNSLPPFLSLRASGGSQAPRFGIAAVRRRFANPPRSKSKKRSLQLLHVPSRDQPRSSLSLGLLCMSNVWRGAFPECLLAGSEHFRRSRRGKGRR